MKIALIQTNPVIGDFVRNSAMILAGIERARDRGCGLAIFPELTLCGYPPQDLLERSAFIEAHDRALETVINRTRGIGVILGALERRPGPGKPLYNSALLINEGRVLARTRKQLLPTYDVFDETRYFEPGTTSVMTPFRELHIGLSVCEDIWSHDRHYSVDPVADMLQSGTTTTACLVNISASPYYHGKIGERKKVFARLCREHRLPLLYVNQVGGQDSLIFDGHSMAMNPGGEIVAAAPGFSEDMLVVDSNSLRAAGSHTLPGDS
ncbi:MAG TPA: NAD+ synthase, partial [Desulfobacteraceae bacterium]|nr:NAD+ synthase [Desulfobacteraceae bacterium]